MSERLRGQEITLQFFADGVRLGGSFLKVTEFTATPRTDLNEEDYLGESATDIDTQHHGWDFSFSIHNLDAAALDFLDRLVFKELAHLPPQEMTIRDVISTPPND